MFCKVPLGLVLVTVTFKLSWINPWTFFFLNTQSKNTVFMHYTHLAVTTGRCIGRWKPQCLKQTAAKKNTQQKTASSQHLYCCFTVYILITWKHMESVFICRRKGYSIRCIKYRSSANKQKQKINLKRERNKMLKEYTYFLKYCRYP